MNRRHFVAGLAAVSTVASAPLLRAAARPAGPKIKLGIDNFAVRAMGWKAPELIAYAAKLKCDTLLISDLDALGSLDDANLRAIRKQADEVRSVIGLTGLHFHLAGLLDFDHHVGQPVLIGLERPDCPAELDAFLCIGNGAIKRGLRSAGVDSSDIIIVGISQDSYNALPDKWPWPRSYYARLVRNLHRAGARAIGLDVIFSASDTGAPWRTR